MTVGVLDYDAGNLTSMGNALSHLGADWVLSGRPEDLAACDRLIVPGDGHAATSMHNLRARGLDALLRRFVEEGRPVLGVCVGSQIVLDASDEGAAVCLGLVPGTCHRLPGGPGLKVPHMGWNEVELSTGHPLTEGLGPRASFYFVHSYYTVPGPDVTVLGRSDHGLTFTVGFVRGSLATWQFHPEKSGPDGLRLVGNFLRWRP